jgi:hypothetical protein
MLVYRYLKVIELALSNLESQIPGESIRMATPPPAPSTKCHYRSCQVAGSNVPRINFYAPGCDRVFHLFCYSQGVLIKNNLDHFDEDNAEHPFLKIACKKGCYKKALRHQANM